MYIYIYVHIYIYIFTRTSKVSETQVSLPYLQFSLVRLVSKYLQRTPPWVAAGWVVYIPTKQGV